MDIGIMIAVSAETGDIAKLAREIEKLGYESFFVPEHPVIPIEFKSTFAGGGKLPEHCGRWMDPFIVLSIAASATTRMKLGTGICLLPEREPIVTAKTIATLDVISGGRVVLGVGAGWLREETEAMGMRFEKRWKRLRETVEAMRVLWTQEEPSYRGDLVSFPPLRCDPKPLQKPCPPILLGARGTKACERVVRTYDGWAPVAESPQLFGSELDELKRAAAQAGRDPKTLNLCAFVSPGDDGISVEDLRLYKATGVHRLILFSQRDAVRTANGRALEVVRRLAPTVERALKI